jgi:formylglycine-generating enzyme required for sulfatase activity
LSEREDLKPYYEMTAKKGGLTSIEAAKVKILGGSGYHIPTDAEWEHGCRAGTNTQYHCGDTDKDLLEYAWFDKKSEGRTYAVGEKKANAFGLHDMHGNVWEWNEEMLTDAQTGGAVRVARGGGWSHTARECVVSCRSRIGLSLGGPAYRISHLGLRVARFP